MGRVVVLGSLNVDLVTDVERHPRPGETVLATGPVRRFAGGKGGNQAVAAAAAGPEVAMVGCRRRGRGRRRATSPACARGIDVSAVRVEPAAPTGQAWITVDADSENAIVVIAGANADLTLDDLEAVSDLGPGDVLLVQLEVPMPVVAAAARRAHGAAARVVVNAAPYAALPHDVAALADPLVVNEHEALALADSDVVPGSVLVTFGGEGCSWDGRAVRRRRGAPGARWSTPPGPATRSVAPWLPRSRPVPTALRPSALRRRPARRPCSVPVPRRTPGWRRPSGQQHVQAVRYLTETWTWS